ncbi:MFS transporter [Demequina sp. NBRC 110057]|uniref:CynX/NimT family MFS transporter n=1 Tax=Demequina sp. NBRC 110057 TaxID=1570346 RepID=UPI000A0753ED|nr:MFS transporter [Demequina sp. NBRC 110057]
MPDAPARRAPRAGLTTASVMTALIFLVALNLRPALTSVGPLLPQLGDDLGLGEGAQGLLTALPLLAFAAVSPLVHLPARRWGMEPTVLVALAVLAGGIAMRSFVGGAGLWIGTAVLGCAIAVGNVLVPALVKRDYAGHVSRATSIYSASMTVGAALASAIAVPLAGTDGWRGSLAFWAIPAILVALIWIPRVRHSHRMPAAPSTAVEPTESVWHQPTAWLVTAYMGLQSTTFYILVNWLPTIDASEGVSASQAGVHLFLFQLVGVLSGLAIPRLMRADTQVLAAAVAGVPTIIGVAGLLLAPTLSGLWVVFAGAGSGASLVIALSLFGLRGRTAGEAARLSGMAQSLGYLLAAAGPVTAGWLAQATGAWHASLLLVLALATAQFCVAFPVGRERRGT